MVKLMLMLAERCKFCDCVNVIVDMECWSAPYNCMQSGGRPAKEAGGGH